MTKAQTNSKPNPFREDQARRLESLTVKADEPLAKELRESAGEIRRTGRKPFPEARRRKNPISIRFTDGELEFLRLIADEKGRELAELVHEWVMASAEENFIQRPKNKDAGDL